MKSAKLFLSLTVFFSSVLLAGDKEDIIKQIMASNDYVNKTKTNMSEYSKEGALEFWSSGGLLHEVGPDGRSDEYESFNMSIKHVEVLILVPKKAAVAMYYSEGSMTPKGSKPVGHYMTRVTQAFVKENGEWRVRASHWSPIMGGAGTSQTATN
ncbi:MAG: hypothetical protein MK411_11235 [SAR202 cluster bacterium]|jgi:hypothetical protein|nr:hypothetical protein [SAR202 cluster bacterium]|tara:strand:+ start:110 stop:571 length:462 start_codon:yes stop_codon:yes gene_type:complete